MKTALVLCVLLVAVASAQYLSQAEEIALAREGAQPLVSERSYVSAVELVDELQTAPNPSLVPHYFLQSSENGIGKSIKKTAKKIGSAVSNAAKKVASAVSGISKEAKKAAKKQAKKDASKLKKLAAAAANGSKKAVKALAKATKKAGKHLKNMSEEDKAKLKKQISKAKAASKDAKKLTTLTVAQKAKVQAKLAEKRKKQQKKLDKRAKRTDKKVRHAMDKISHLHTSMDSLKRLMGNINNQIQGLLPEQRIKKYGLEDVSKIAHSQNGRLKGDPKKLVNGFKPAENNNAESYGNKDIIPNSTPVIRKGDDMKVQEMDAGAKELGKFTKKLADKDRISLV